MFCDKLVVGVFERPIYRARSLLSRYKKDLDLFMQYIFFACEYSDIYLFPCPYISFFYVSFITKTGFIGEYSNIILFVSLTSAHLPLILLPATNPISRAFIHDASNLSVELVNLSLLSGDNHYILRERRLRTCIESILNRYSITKQ